MRRELQTIFHAKTLDEWVAIAIEHDIAMGPAHRAEDLRDDPQLRSREIIFEGVHPDAGPFSSVGWPAPISGQAFDVYRPAPALGQHTEEILGELGFSADQVGALRAAKVI